MQLWMRAPGAEREDFQLFQFITMRQGSTRGWTRKKSRNSFAFHRFNATQTAAHRNDSTAKTYQQELEARQVLAATSQEHDAVDSPTESSGHHICLSPVMSFTACRGTLEAQEMIHQKGYFTFLFGN